MPRLLNLDRSFQPFQIKNKTATSAEIILYGAIGTSWYEDAISAKQFSDEINKLEPTVKNLTVRINSPGGDVFDGISIYNRLKQHPAKVTVYIDGLAASIASIIALAGDEVIMGEGALYMIHLPSTVAAGDRNNFENTINLLMDVEEQLISIYQAKCGKKKTRNEIRAMMENETWLDSTQAIAEGFCDSTTSETMPIAASVLDRAKWLNKVPRGIKTLDDEVKTEIENLRSKIEKVLARK